MSNKKIKSAISVMLVIGIFFLSSCSSNSTPKYADKAFIQSMSKGLEARWALTDKDEEKKITVEMMNGYIQAELDQVTKYESATFEDTKLQEKALKYINCLKDSKENVNWYFSDNFEEMEKWEKIKNTRSVLIKDFVENYGLTVSEKYQSTLDEFLATGKSVENKESEKAAVQKLVDDLEFKKVKEEYDWITYQADLINTSNYDIESVSVDISLLDKEGTIIETQYASAENVSKGQKAKMKFSTDTKFDKIKVVLNYYEIKE